MGCASCGSSGTPGGCKNHGTCSSGGCNKLEVYDWLANMKLPAGKEPYDIIEVRFKNGRKSFYRNSKGLTLQAGDAIIVEGNPGKDVGVVSVVGELARIQVQKKAPGLKPGETLKIIDIADQEAIDRWIKARSLEREVMYQARTLAVNLNLQMKISDVEYQADLTKATFFYTAEGRVDFRQLIKDMADKFRIRIEMRQIGSRQEASRLGGIGSCGRELCCSTWLTDFRSVSTSAARYQQLSLNPQKLAGQCGKLKCCLNYELDMYLDGLKAFPKGDIKLRTEKGTAVHIKTDVFKRQMWYVYEGEAGIGSGLIPLNPERVREIARMNKEGQKPADLMEFVAVVEKKIPDYTNVVGQDSLNRFDSMFKTKKKRPSKNKNRKPNTGEKPVNQTQENPQAQPRTEAKPGEVTGAAAPKKRRNNNRRRKPNNPNNPNSPNQGGNEKE